MIFLDLNFVLGLARIFLNFLDLSFAIVGLSGFFFYIFYFNFNFLFKFFGFEFCGKICVLLLWLWLGLGMGKIGADLRLEREI